MKLPLLLTGVLFSFTLRLFASVQDTVITERHYSKKQLNDDISYLTQTVNRVHPNMYHSISARQYQRLTDSVRNVLQEGMTEKQAWPVLARLVGAINEGHSTFNYPDSLIGQLKNGSHHLFPVLIKEFDGNNLVVRADASAENKLLPGDQITSINGISSLKLIDVLSGYTGGLKSHRAIDVCLNLITYLYLYNISSPYQVSYLRAGRSGNVTIGAVSWPELKNTMAAKAKTLPKLVAQPAYVFNFSGQNTAYLTVNSLTAEPERFNHFLDSCFSSLKKSSVTNLVIDLRKNGGGNSTLAQSLLTYITDEPFRMTGGVHWKVSQEYKDQLNSKLKGEGAQTMGYYFNARNGSLLKSSGSKPEKLANNPLLFKGKVFVLIGPHTFSSANMLVNTIQDYKLATLVGEPSGEPANDYGELIFLKLPNTGFTFSTSTKQFIRANGDAKDQHPVLPEYNVSDNPLTAQDEVIEFVKAKIGS